VSAGAPLTVTLVEVLVGVGRAVLFGTVGGFDAAVWWIVTAAGAVIVRGDALGEGEGREGWRRATGSERVSAWLRVSLTIPAAAAAVAFGAAWSLDRRASPTTAMLTPVITRTTARLISWPP